LVKVQEGLVISSGANWSFHPGLAGFSSRLAGFSSRLAGSSSELGGFSSELGVFSYELAGFLSKTKGAMGKGIKKGVPLYSTFVNLKSNTMKNTLQRYE